MTNNIQRRMKPSEVAAIWNCSSGQILNLIRSGRLRAINIGSKQRARYVIDPEEIERFEKGQVTTQPSLRRPKRPNVKQYV